MNRFLRPRIILAIAGLLVTRANASAPKQGDPAAGRKAIQQVLDRQTTAWNKGDLEGFMAGYWKSPKLTFFSAGDKTKGWQGTIERYRKKYQTGEAKMGKLTFSELEIEVLGQTSAWVRGRWQVVRGKETLGGLFTLVFKKLPEGWRIVHDHTSAAPPKESRK